MVRLALQISNEPYANMLLTGAARNRETLQLFIIVHRLQLARDDAHGARLGTFFSDFFDKMNFHADF